MERLVSDAERLSARQEGLTGTQKWNRWWKDMPRRVRTYGPDVMGWASGAGIFLWEGRNATLGFEQMWRPGIWWAAAGGLATSLAVVFLVRTGCESIREMFTDEGRAKRELHMWVGVGKFVLAMMAFSVLLFGVWSNLAADSVRRGNTQIETVDERAAILKNIRSLEGEVRALPLSLEAGLEADREALAKVQNIGRQWDLPELNNDPGGDCDAQLNPYPRSLCNQAADLRADIATAERAIAVRIQLQTDLELERSRLVDEVSTEGVEHLQEMASMLGDTDQWKMVGNVATLIASLFLGIIGAFIIDLMIERGERRKAKGV